MTQQKMTLKKFIAYLDSELKQMDQKIEDAEKTDEDVYSLSSAAEYLRYWIMVGKGQRRPT